MTAGRDRQPDGRGQPSKSCFEGFTQAPSFNGTITQTRSYHATRDLLDSIETKYSTATKARFAYTYDTQNRAIAITKTGELYNIYGNGTEGLVTDYGYNDRSEVIIDSTVLGSSSTVLTGRDDSYTYDTIGNRKTATHNGNTANYNPSGYPTNNLNQYIRRTVPDCFDVAGSTATGNSVTVNGSSSGVVRHGPYYFKGQALGNSGGAVYTNTLAVTEGTSSFNLAAFLAAANEPMAYDADGNLTSDGRWDYTYDAENRLTAMQTHTTSPITNAARRWLEFKYDYRGRRVEKIVHGGYDGTGYTTVPSDEKFVWNGWVQIAKLNANNSNELKASYYWGIDLSGTMQGAGGTGGLLMSVESGTTYVAMYDGLGNVHGMINAANGNLDAAYEYDAFGKTLRAMGTYAANNAFGFSTKYTDVESGLVYFGHRFYSPSLGRFLNRDPIAEQGGLNLYGFCGNDAINHTDYLGYWGLKDLLNPFSGSNPLNPFSNKNLRTAAMLPHYGNPLYWAAPNFYRKTAPLVDGFVVGAVVTYFAGPTAGGAAAGWVSGFEGGLLNGASLGDSAEAGVVGAAMGAFVGAVAGGLNVGPIPANGTQYFTQLAGMAVAGGVAGGLQAEYYGGNFSDGFRRGATYAAAGYVFFTGLNTYLNEKGETIFPDGGSKNTADYNQVTTNGVMGNRAAFQTMVTQGKSALGYFNPSQGIINDTMQSFFQKVLFGWGDSLAKGFGNLTSQMMPGPLTITAHSQGTLTVTNAIFQGGVPRGSTLNLLSPAISYPRAWLAGQINGGTMNYLQPWGDGASMWAISLNPFKIAVGATDIFSGFGVHRGNYP
jgi:RHS repeat-associated protein